MNKVIHSDNLPFLQSQPDETIDLIYIDPPFNTGKTQQRKRIKADKTDTGLVGFGGERYERIELGNDASFEDTFENFVEFMRPRLVEAKRILKPTGCIYVHLDYREVHYIKVLMDEIFGRKNFINEIIWSYEWGAKSRNKWSAKHDTILYYVKDQKNYTFNYDKVPRVPYLAPSLQTEERALLGKTICDTWFHTIVGTNSKEKTGYPTQKPVGILKRIVEVCSNPGDVCLDFFAGSGSLGQVCLDTGREFILVDRNQEAIDVMKKRFDGEGVLFQ